MDENANISPSSTAGTENRPFDLHSRISNALLQLSICSRSVAQYGRSHPVIEEMSWAAHQSIVELLVVQPTVVIACTDNYFAIESFPVDDATGSLGALSQTLSKRGISELKLTSSLTCEELVEFSEVLTMAPEDLMLRGGMAVELNRRNVLHIQTRSGVFPENAREGKDPAEIYEEALLLAEEAMRAVECGLQIPVPEIRGVVADSLQSLVHDDTALLALTGIRSYDRYLSEHSVNVCILSMVLGKDLGLDASSTLEVGISAMLHDVGKVFVDPEIVKKPGRLTEEEWQQIRKHPAEGARVLAGLADLPALASTIALEHHIRADGSGYPALLSHEKPHLLSRLVAIVDTYDALTTDRPYRERWPGEKAIAWMIYEAPGQYDRQLLARFAAHAKLYPLGSLVKLKRGDFAIVVGGSFEQPRKPVLRMIANPEHEQGASLEVDLRTNQDPALEIDCVAQPVEVLLPYVDRLAA